MKRAKKLKDQITLFETLIGKNTSQTNKKKKTKASKTKTSEEVINDTTPRIRANDSHQEPESSGEYSTPTDVFDNRSKSKRKRDSTSPYIRTQKIIKNSPISTPNVNTLSSISYQSYDSAIQQNDINLLEMEREIMKSQISSLQTQVNSLISSNQLSNFMIKMTKFADTELDSRIDKLHKECALKEAESTFYKDRVQEIQLEKNEIEKQLSHMQKEEMRMSSEFIRLQLQISEQFQRYEDLEYQLETEREAHRNLFEKCQKLEIDIKILETEKRLSTYNQNSVNELREQLKMKTELIDRQNEEIERYKRSLSRKVEKDETMEMALRSEKTPIDDYVFLSKKAKTYTPFYSPLYDENDHHSPNFNTTPSKKVRGVTTSPMAILLSREKALSPGKSPKKSTPKSQKKEQPRKSRSLWFKNRDSPKKD